MTYKIQTLFLVKALYDLTEVTVFIALSLRQYLTSYAEFRMGTLQQKTGPYSRSGYIWNGWNGYIFWLKLFWFISLYTISYLW
jgi:hypothetical protein